MTAPATPAAAAPTAAPAAPAPQPARGNDNLITGLLILLATLAIIIAAAMLYSTFGRVIAAPAATPQKTKIVCANGTTIDVDNQIGNGINIAVAGCQEKVVTLPCSANCAPAPQRMSFCYVRVDLTQHDRVSPYHKAMPLVVTDKSTGRVLGHVTLAGGQNLVSVPCNGGREICLTLNGQRTEVLAPEWFVRNRGNLKSDGVFNSKAPVIFSSRA